MARGFSLSKAKGNSVSDKMVPIMFLKQMEEAIVEVRETRMPSTYYTPSSLIDLREMYFKRIGAEPDEEDIDSSGVGILESGTDRHERVQEALLAMKDLGKDFEYYDVEQYVKEHGLDYIEIKDKRGIETHCIDTRYDLSFMVDGIIKFRDKFYIFEFKTEASVKWNYRDTEELTHQVQAACYSLSFGIEDVLFVYENRDFCTKKAFLYTPTQQDIQTRVIDKIKACEDYVARGEVPPKLQHIDVDPNYKEEDYIGTTRMKPADKVTRYSRYKTISAKYV